MEEYIIEKHHNQYRILDGLRIVAIFPTQESAQEYIDSIKKLSEEAKRSISLTFFKSGKLNKKDKRND